MAAIKLTVNGKPDVEDRTLLVHLRRNHLGLTGTHVGCDTSQCGPALEDGEITHRSVFIPFRSRPAMPRCAIPHRAR